MAIKVIGTGAPRMLTVRFRRCEIDVLLDELHHHRAVVTEAAAHVLAKSTAPGAGTGDRAVEDRHDELFLITRLVDDLRAPAPCDRPCEIVAPTWILGPVIRGAAVHAVERLSQAVRTFAADKDELTPDEVRGAVDAAAALTATLIGLDHVEHHAVDA